MSDPGDKSQGPGESSPRGGDQTMQIDALVDADAVLDDVSSAGGEEAPEQSDEGFEDEQQPVAHAPPPLPKRGPSKAVIATGLVVVIALAVGAALAASEFMAPAPHLHASQPGPTPVAPAPVVAAPIVAAPVIEAPRPAHAPVTIEAIEITGGSDEGDAGAR